MRPPAFFAKKLVQSRSSFREKFLLNSHTPWALALGSVIFWYFSLLRALDMGKRLYYYLGLYNMDFIGKSLISE